MFKRIHKALIKSCINYPKLTLGISLIATILVLTGIQYVRQDDNMINLLPEDIGSRQIFREIQDDAGNYLGNPLQESEDYGEREDDLAEHLRDRGYAVWAGHHDTIRFG